MRLPPWAVQAIRNGVADVARKASDPETIKKVRSQATELLRDLPDNASKSIDAIVKSASETARGAFDQGRSTILRWSERQKEIASLGYNASGVLLNELGSGVPVGDRVLQLGCDLLQGDCLKLNARSQIDEALTRQLDQSGNRILVANNFDSAIRSLVALASRPSNIASQSTAGQQDSGQQGRRIVMHRAHAIRLPSGLPLPDLFEGYAIEQCGGVGTVEPSDFRDAGHSIVVMADDGKEPLQCFELAADDTIQVAVLPIATVEAKYADVPDAKSLLKAGFDIVVLQAGPLTGSANAGLIVGKTALLETIESSLVWNFATANDAVAATVLASIVNEPSPLGVLIETGEENLRSRAERMATRLTASQTIKGCKIDNASAVLSKGKRWALPSRQLRLQHQSMAATQWAASLLEQSPAVIASVDADDLVIDLRWVPASADGVIADILAPIDDDQD
ncbi:hypothetical protein LOC67_19880 [Stieleria sp. JC731]|uniref:hypothetical protein n=1 Tax=Pirellulaceae TaxID=2691357 RepID=UPI001E2C87ED|nr:hypothetical protein [Stieleria sp. JC731]MCC9602817.1 hypothetical protein [Stieleria sp. JC731]